jgi:uncharacterized membrane protein YfcA
MIIILTLLTLLTSTISAIIGMGGGVLLLSLMTFFMSYQTIIPVHGLVQLVSNSSRVYFLRHHTRWVLFRYFMLGAPLGAWLATVILKKIIDNNIPLLLVALFILYAVFRPKKMPHLNVPDKGWVGIGFLAGVLGIIIGAVGPLIAPFFLRDDLKKEEIIATKASVQMFTHAMKIPAFLYLEFNYLKHLDLIIMLSIAAIIGTSFGVKLLKNINENVFRSLFKTVLVLAALRLIWKFISGLE